MPGPGEYAPIPPRASPASRTCPSPDPLPEPKLPSSTLSTLRRAYRDRRVRRTLHDLGNPRRSAPRTDCDLFPALLHPLSQVFQCRHDGPGCTR